MFNSVERGPASVKCKMDAIKILNILLNEIVGLLIISKVRIWVNLVHSFVLYKSLLLPFELLVCFCCASITLSLHHFLETFLIVNRRAAFYLDCM